MPVFDYLGGNDTQLIKDALTLAKVYWGGNTDQNYQYSATDGWEILDKNILNYDGKVNPHGAFYGEKALFRSAEANVMGKYDAEGHLVNIGINFWGTGADASASSLEQKLNSWMDIGHDLASAIPFANVAVNYVMNAYSHLMSSVADFARENGLTGNDIIVSGHSLGGLAVNSMATLSAEGAWDGFFTDSKYIAFASPIQNQLNDNVLNIGYENDPVFRALNGDAFTSETLFRHDTPRETATNNIVNFNDYHGGMSAAGILNPMSIVYLPSWLAHVGSEYADGVSRIMNADIYDLTHQDSTIIVSNLSEPNRSKVWVEDLNQSNPHTGSTFIVGTETNDLLKGGSGNDYLYGGGGDDSFKDHSGYNVIYGGEGENTYITESKISDFSFSHDLFGNLYFKYSTGDITKAENISYVNVDYTKYNLFGFDIKGSETYNVTDYGLEGDNNSYSYFDSYYANTDNNFTISTAANDNWFFSGDNDSNISITGQFNNIVSGAGSDIFNLSGSDNTMLFYGDFGHDTVYNLSTTDSLVFMQNQDIGQSDSYLNHLSFIDDNALLSFGENSVTLVGVNADMLSGMNIAVA